MSSNPICNLRVSRQDAERRISERIGAGETLRTTVKRLSEEVRRAYERPPNPEHEEKRDSLWADYSRWNDFNKELLDRLFDSPKIVAEYNASLLPEPSFGVFLIEIEHLAQHLTDDLKKLQSIKERLPLFDEIPQTNKNQGGGGGKHGQVVFVVHGRNELVLTQTQLLLQSLGLEQIVLRDQVESGSPTLIEKFERYAKAARYAVVLMTGDDEGRMKQEPNMLAPRARQNVILEFGYFVGALTREMVCVLYESGVETPSDILGVEYVPLDGVGRWKHTLAKKLHSAGFNVDLSKVV